MGTKRKKKNIEAVGQVLQVAKVCVRIGNHFSLLADYLLLRNKYLSYRCYVLHKDLGGAKLVKRVLVCAAFFLGRKPPYLRNCRELGFS